MDYYYFHNPNVDAASGSLSLSWSSSSSSKASTSKNRKNKKNGGAKKSTKGSVMKLSTDPQSIAARERRHRISDRFKILQSLVPGGSKMDTVSMLEEAIQYVKFLKNQIWLHQSMMMIADLTSENSCDVDVMEQVPTPTPTPSSDLLLPCSCGTYNNYDCDQVGLGLDNDDLFAQLRAELPPLTLPEPCFQGQESHVLWFSGGAHEDMK